MKDEGSTCARKRKINSEQPIAKSTRISAPTHQAANLDEGAPSDTMCFPKKAPPAPLAAATFRVPVNPRWMQQILLGTKTAHIFATRTHKAPGRQMRIGDTLIMNHIYVAIVSVEEYEDMQSALDSLSIAAVAPDMNSSALVIRCMRDRDPCLQSGAVCGVRFTRNAFTAALDSEERRSVPMRLPRGLTEAQNRAISHYVLNQTDQAIDLKVLIAAMQAAACPYLKSPLNDRMLRNWVQRRNQKIQELPTRNLTPAQLRTYFQTLRGTPTAAEPTRLTVIDDFTISDDWEVFVPISCWAMLQLAHRCLDTRLALGMDGKHNAMPYGLVVITLGPLAIRDGFRRTTIRRYYVGNGLKRLRLQSRELTTSKMPFIQVICNSENRKLTARLFQLVIKFWDIPTASASQDFMALQLEDRVLHAPPAEVDGARTIPPPPPTQPPPSQNDQAAVALLPLVTRWVQLHKDHSHAFDTARREILRTTRSMGDFSHMARNVHSKAKVKMYKGVLLKHLQPLLHLTRKLPTVELYSALWRQVFKWMRAQNWHWLIHYLTKEYIKLHTASSLRQMRPLTLLALGDMLLRWSDTHTGLFSIIPGTDSGSQTSEAVNRSWACRLQKGKAPANVAGGIAIMQSMYDDWLLSLQLLSKAPLTLIPPNDPRLLMRDGLAKTLESTAADLHYFHTVKGIKNHRLISSSRMANTDYIVFAVRSFASFVPADGTASADEAARPAAHERTVDPAGAEQFIEFLELHGDELDALLSMTGTLV